MDVDKIGIVLTGGDFQGLGVLRTFGEKNIPIVLTDNEHCIGRYSRYRKRFFPSPNPANEEAYTDFLINLARRHGLEGWVVFPNSDQVVRVLSRNRELLQRFYRIPVPGWEVIKWVYVKENTYKIAHENRIPAPKTYYASCLEEMLGNDLPYPVIIKPSIRDNFYSKVKIKAFLVNNEEELIRTYRNVSKVIDPSEILVQEFLKGGPQNLYSFCPFFKEGKVIVGIAGRRTRQHPMDFGHSTTYAELVDIPELKATAEAFLSSIRYYGVAEVEFMRDPNEASYKLIEVNPRVWGWHALAIYAGVDLPYMLYKDMLGEPIDPPDGVKNVRWMRLTTDIPTVALEVAKGRMAIGEYLRTVKSGTRDAVFSIKDPLPFLAELLMIPYLWCKRGF